MNRPISYSLQLLFVFVCCLIFKTGNGQDVEKKRFVITNITDYSELLFVDSIIQSLDGAHMIRTDFNTRNSIGLFPAEHNYSRAFFTNLLSPHGFGVKCYTSEPYAGQPMPPVHPRYCRDVNEIDSVEPERVNGPCCTAHTNTGCFDAGCQTAVCNLDAFCCNNQWDGLCANEAIANANANGVCAGVSDCPGSPGGGNGACCSANGTPGCENPACEAAVCAADAFCCNSTWDGICADLAIGNANANGACAGVSNCPDPGGGGNDGGCCQAGGNGTPGCNNAACEAAICAIDPFCCNFTWDGLCAGEAIDNAIAVGPCSGVSDCPTGNDGGPVTAGDCVNAINVCTDLTFSVDPNGFGDVNEMCTCCTSNPCTNPASGNDGCLLAGELNSTWMIINVQTAGVLEFSFGNLVGFNCYDWIMYPYDSNTCSNILNNNIAPIRCNWNFPCQSFTGVGLPPPPGGNAGNFEPALNVNAGDQFVICFSNYSSAVTLVPLQFGGTAGVSCTPLPVELLTFSGMELNGDALLKWETATETNNDFFSLERSRDGVSWETIATINGAGFSGNAIQYQHIDKNLSPGLYYYRLYQQDYDGSIKQIGELAVTISGEVWTVFPNPSANHWQMSIPDGISGVQIEMRNTAGQLVPFKHTSTEKSMIINLRQHVPGLYFLRVLDARGDELYTTRLVAN